MTKTKLNLFGINVLTIFFAVAVIAPAMAANVVQRGRVSASTNSAPGTRGAATRPAVTPSVVAPIDEPEPAPAPTVIADVSSQFTVNTDTSESSKDSALSDAIARQRAALDAQSATSNVTTLANKISDGANKCDTDLRKCMTEKCGENFANCITDSTTIWGTKMDGCRTKTECTAAEYNAFATEIRADRDFASAMATYDGILKCGNNYNTCITDKCGKTYSKCLGKSNMDAAIAECKTISQQCTEYDSGLAARTGTVIATIRDGVEKQIATDEKRLYTLRDEMRKTCERMGAMLDERTMNCVYTVEFYADNNGEQTLFASKKAYAGATFDCTPNWFGIDITTFKENAYRLTRGQVGASSAMLGSGVGTAAGLITSGALNRAIETQKAEKAVKKAEKEYDAAKKDGVPTASTTSGNGTQTVDNDQTLSTGGGGSGIDKNTSKQSAAEREKAIDKKVDDITKNINSDERTQWDGMSTQAKRNQAALEHDAGRMNQDAKQKVLDQAKPKEQGLIQRDKSSKASEKPAKTSKTKTGGKSGKGGKGGAAGGGAKK